jgi:hypothetical protein
LTLAYTVGAEQVYLNGVLLVRTTDYTATNGTSVVLALAATASDTLVVVAYGAFNVANTYTQAQADARYPLNSIDLSAGKNKLINPDFLVNQRGFTSTTTSSVYTFDRWVTEFLSVTTTYTPQTFTPGTAPVAGYEGTNFLRIVTASAAASSYALIQQKIEDVRTFANQTVTVSFWAKAGSGTPKISARATQIFGTGGSTFNPTNATTAATISTSWARYSFTMSIPSVAGKTIGTGSNLAIAVIVDDDLIGTGVGVQNNTFDIWGVQVEAGTVATAFQTATGTIQGELAACQRYYYLAASGVGANISMAACYTANACYGVLPFKVSMRTAPTLEQTTGTNYYNLLGGNAGDSFDSFTSITAATTETVRLDVASGIVSTQLGAYWFTINNASARLAFSAEL